MLKQYIDSLDFHFEIDPVIASILDKALNGKDLDEKDCLEILNATGTELHIAMLVADFLRKEQVGDIVTFVVNRNINFTNICKIKCGFCAFSRDENDPGAYLMSIDEIVRRAKEAWSMGATEVCIQGGIHPNIDPMFYVQICKAIKKELPKIHIHAFSPMEIVHGAEKSGLGLKEFLLMLKDAGLDSMPGTAAEILDNRVRKIICPNKISSEAWIEVIKTAHKLGIPTTATMMYGHVEDNRDICRHILMLRDLQKDTGGFTEFIPLSFVHYNTPIYKKGISKAGATGLEDLRIFILSRLVLGRYLKNIQVSWVKLGPKFAQVCLMAGANDLGGTLFEENISRLAGSPFGQSMSIDDMVRMIKSAGRIPAQRTTLYEILRTF